MSDDQQRYRVRKRKVTDYERDPANANRGSRRGARMLKQSYKRNGAGRSWLVDKDGQLIAGNHARDAAIESGLEEVIEVEVLDPSLQLVVRRPDLDLDDKSDQRARELAFADNQTSAVGLEWSPDQVRAHEELLREAELMRDDEIEAVLGMGDAEDLVDGAVQAGKVAHNNRDALDGRQAKISPVLYMDDLAAFEDAILMARRITGKRRRGDCLRYVCEFFISQHTDDEIEELLDGEA